MDSAYPLPPGTSHQASPGILDHMGRNGAARVSHDSRVQFRLVVTSAAVRPAGQAGPFTGNPELPYRRHLRAHERT